MRIHINCEKHLPEITLRHKQNIFEDCIFAKVMTGEGRIEEWHLLLKARPFREVNNFSVIACVFGIDKAQSDIYLFWWWLLFVSTLVPFNMIVWYEYIWCYVMLSLCLALVVIRLRFETSISKSLYKFRWPLVVKNSNHNRIM